MPFLDELLPAKSVFIVIVFSFVKLTNLETEDIILLSVDDELSKISSSFGKLTYAEIEEGIFFWVDDALSR